MKRRKAIALVSSLIIILTLVFTSVFTYAYYLSRITVYTNDNNKEYARIGMNLSLLFDRLDKDEFDSENPPSLKILKSKEVNAEGESTETYYDYNSSSEWGTAENPYIISNLRHLQNLSVLWGIGYFDDYIEAFDAEELESVASASSSVLSFSKGIFKPSGKLS